MWVVVDRSKFVLFDFNFSTLDICSFLYFLHVVRAASFVYVYTIKCTEKELDFARVKDCIHGVNVSATFFFLVRQESLVYFTRLWKRVSVLGIILVMEKSIQRILYA